MNGRFERQFTEDYKEYDELDNLGVVRLEAAVVNRADQEEDMDRPYIRVYDLRSRKRMVAQLPGNLNNLPEKIVVSCYRSGYTASLEARELIDCYLRAEPGSNGYLEIVDAYDESIRSRISLIVPQKSKEAFDNKLAEAGYELVSDTSS